MTFSFCWPLSLPSLLPSSSPKHLHSTELTKHIRVISYCLRSLNVFLRLFKSLNWYFGSERTRQFPTNDVEIKKRKKNSPLCVHGFYNAKLCWLHVAVLKRPREKYTKIQMYNEHTEVFFFARCTYLFAVISFLFPQFFFISFGGTQ